MVDQNGRKVRVELTPLEAEALHAVAAESIGDKLWEKFSRRRGAGVASAALRRAVEKIGAEVKR